MQQFATLKKSTITVNKNSVISIKKIGSTPGYDGHCLRAYAYFKDAMPTIIDTVDSINSIASVHEDLRSASKQPTFLLTYRGTYHGLMRQLGWTKEKAIDVEEKYHTLYKHSDDVINARLDQACKDGYVTVAFGLRLRTPMLKKIISLTSATVPYEAQAESRTAANAMGQSYGLLNNRAAIDFMIKVWKSPYIEDIKMSSLIHDAIYLVIKDDIAVIDFTNRELIGSMAWQDLPELHHPTVKIGAQLDIFYPTWADKHSLPINATINQIFEIAEKANENSN
jgi:DNA polymerase-1